VYGTWSYDKANGMARVLKKDSSDFRIVIFKNDMMIEDPGSINMTCGDIAYLIFAILFLLIFIGGIIAGIVAIKVAFAATGGAWVIYQLMNCCNSSTKYIWGL